MQAQAVYNNRILYRVPKTDKFVDDYVYVLFKGADATKAREANSTNSDGTVKGEDLDKNLLADKIEVKNNKEIVALIAYLQRLGTDIKKTAHKKSPLKTRVMKFTNYLKSIEHVSIYPIASLILFTAVFVVVVLYVFTADKNALQEKANIPNR
jgi:hypothetical protein